ncbi:hypothetical protein VF21_07019 [Pseudogymnoascus sp. 05NY08]|nr:hypothetical protein VF21_07019 [Pseudogymnoascus sp. 05NY08]
MASKDTFPFILGHDAAGTIIAVGSGVHDLKVGDEVFTREPNHLRGTIAEYCISSASATARKLASMTFVDAASIPLVDLSMLQAMRPADADLDGGLKGKTAFVPGGLSGTGSLAVQLLRDVFGVKKVITTLSPGKMKRAKELWKDGDGEVVYLDYTKGDVNSAIGPRTVDFMLDTMASAMESLPLIRHGGVIVTISKTPSGDELKRRFESAPWIMVALLNLEDGAFPPVRSPARSLTGWNFEYFDEPDENGYEWHSWFNTAIGTRRRCFDNNRVQCAAGGRVTLTVAAMDNN